MLDLIITCCIVWYFDLTLYGSRLVAMAVISVPMALFAINDKLGEIRNILKEHPEQNGSKTLNALEMFYHKVKRGYYN